MKYLGITGVLLTAAFAILGLVASAASAVEPLGGPLACYEISNFSAKKVAGNWSNATCTTEVTKLTGKFVLALPVTWLKENLWCALITPYVVGKPSETGTWEDEKCSKAKSNGEYTEVKWVKLPAITIEDSEPTVLINSASDHPTNNGILSKLETAAAVLEGKGLLLEITLLNTATTSGVGIYLVLFLEVINPSTGEKCSTAGDATGEVLLPTNTILLVSTAGSTGALQVGTLFDVSEFTITCSGGFEVKPKGSVLGYVEPIESKLKKEGNEGQGALRCTSTSGKPEKTKFTNQKGETGEANLKVKAGGVNESGCELITNSSTGTITLLPTKAVELFG